MDELPWLHAKRRAVNKAAVNKDVAVNNKLAGLGRGTSETGPYNKSVETYFQKFYKIFTSQALCALSLLKGDTKLLVANAILGAKTLFFSQADSVVRVGFSLGPAMLPRGIGALFEVFCRFRRQGNA